MDEEAPDVEPIVEWLEEEDVLHFDDEEPAALDDPGPEVISDIHDWLTSPWTLDEMSC